MIKTYRGLLADGGQDRIRLQTIKGKVGYKIVKFQLMVTSPGSADVESCVKIFKESQGTPTNLIDFTDSTLLAAGYTMDSGSVANTRLPSTVIFDNEVVNQDIFVTNFAASGSASCNYYLELEVIPLDDLSAEYTTLKDMRQA